MLKILLILSCLFTLSFQATAQQATLADSTDFQNAIANGDQIVDVRTEAEFFTGHIAGAKLADWKNRRVFRRNVRKLKKDEPVYIYCASSRRSSEAAAWLSRKGFSQIFNLEGGIKKYPGLITEKPR